MYTTGKRANCPGETLLANALNADASANFELAFEYYQRGITYYLQVRMVNETNSSIQASIRQICHQHLQRAEMIKSYVEIRNAANLHLTNAENAYKRLQYVQSYPLFMEGIEKLLESANLIKPSHPQLSNTILSTAAAHMTHAEEVNKIIHPTTSPQIAVLVSSDTDDVNSPCYTENYIESNDRKLESSNIIEPESCRGSMIDVVQCQTSQQTNKRQHTEETKIRALLYRQRIDALITESHLLLDYLKLDTENEVKFEEMGHVTIQISNLLEETNESGTLIVGEHSADREKLDTSLQTCLDFLATPQPSSIVETEWSSGEKEIEEQEEQEQGQDQERRRESDKDRRSECLVCCDQIAVMATVPCGHKILCQQCVVDIGDDKLETCYLCKTILIEPKCIRIFD